MSGRYRNGPAHCPFADAVQALADTTDKLCDGIGAIVGPARALTLSRLPSALPDSAYP